MTDPRLRHQEIQLSHVLLTAFLMGLWMPGLARGEQETPPEPPPSIAQIVAVLDDADAATKLLEKLPATIEPADLAKLRELDRKLAAEPWAERNPIARKLLEVLAKAGESRSLGYLHEVFETEPERRQHVAQEIARFALEQRRRADDWRLLIRAVPIVEDQAAREVLRALQKFNQRGTKPQWQREIILAGLRLGAADCPEALGVLRHWTGQAVDEGVAPDKALAAWQAWFEREHPELPAPTLPVDAPNSRHKSAELVALLSSSPEPGDPQRGALVLEKAACLKCHRFGNRGEAMGPDITNVRQRFQLKELVEEVVFPSQRLTDQYGTVTVLTRDGKSYSGVTAADGDQLVVLQVNGEKVHINRSAIAEATPSRKSAMPNGLLEPLTREEVVDLFAFLRRSER